MVAGAGSMEKSEAGALKRSRKSARVTTSVKQHIGLSFGNFTLNQADRETRVESLPDKHQDIAAIAAHDFLLILLLLHTAFKSCF